MHNVPRWPLIGIADERGRLLPYVGLQQPAMTREEEEDIRELEARVSFVGFTSLLTFPRWRPADDPFDYTSLCRGWCHCFRNPDQYLPAGVPAVLNAFSDFIDYQRTSRDALLPGGPAVGPAWDFLYVCPAESAKAMVKNWPLASRCLPVLCGELGLRGIVVGRRQIGDLPECADRLTVTDELPWPALMRVLANSRMLFVPNEQDPSPRLMAEALCMDVPVVVNRRILGGWHYVNPFTGVFFDDEGDVGAAVRDCLTSWTSPRRWFIAHHGPLHAGERLRRLLRDIDPAMRHVAAVRLVVDTARHCATERR